MSANGISTYQYKRDRVIAKLELAQDKREALGYELDQYDITLLPTIYATGDNDTNNVVDNPNEGGLQPARPWKASE